LWFGFMAALSCSQTSQLLPFPRHLHGARHSDKYLSMTILIFSVWAQEPWGLLVCPMASGWTALPGFPYLLQFVPPWPAPSSPSSLVDFS
jgi:hypothetical protein